jgi:hypothetical protein
VDAPHDGGSGAQGRRLDNRVDARNARAALI